LLVFCAAAKHLRHREKWIGWTEAQRRKRLGLVTHNARFLILPQYHYPNLAPRVLGLCLEGLPQDWQGRYAHPVWLAESFVDTQLFRGTADKASGWTELGPTQGYGRCQQDYYVKHERPKALFVKELKKKARRSLCAGHLPPQLAAVVESKVVPRPTLRVAELGSLREHFASVPDFRGRVECYPLSSVLTIVACAHPCGAPRGHRDLKAFARGLTQAQLRALGVRRDRKSGRYPSPKQGHLWARAARGGSVAGGSCFAGVAGGGARARARAGLAGRRWQGTAPRPRSPSGHAHPSRQPVLSGQPVGRG